MLFLEISKRVTPCGQKVYLQNKEPLTSKHWKP